MQTGWWWFSLERALSNQRYYWTSRGSEMNLVATFPFSQTSFSRAGWAECRGAMIRMDTRNKSQALIHRGISRPCG